MYQSSYKRNLFYLFLCCCLLDALLVLINSEFLLYSRVICTLSLIPYYVVSVSRVNYVFVAVLLFFGVADGFFSVNISSPYGFGFIAVTMFLLLIIILKNTSRVDKKIFAINIILLSSFTFFIFSNVSVRNIQFFFTLVTSILLIILFSLLFNKLLYTNDKSVKELFFAVVIYIITGAIFTMNDIRHLGSVQTRLIITSTIYRISYYLMCSGMIKKSPK